MSPPLDLAELGACGAHQRGHFLLSSGLHSADYLQCALLLARPWQAERAGQELATAVRSAGLAPELVVSPALGGVVIGHEVARSLRVPSFFTERAEGRMALRRGFAVAAGTRTLVVEDVVTTGKSTREVIALLESAGAEAVGVASIVNRSDTDNPFAPLPFVSLLELSFPTWPPDECPLCAAGGPPAVKPGSRPTPSPR